MTASTLPHPSPSSSFSLPPHKPLHERFRCSVCNASYARSGHLRRHEVTHSGEKNFVCEFCGRRFFRVDTARRHAASCSSRGDQPGLPQQKRGKKRKACDACARSKIGCDAADICKNCRLSKTPCTYFRLAEQLRQQQQARQNNAGSATSSSTSLLYTLHNYKLEGSSASISLDSTANTSPTSAVDLPVLKTSPKTSSPPSAPVTATSPDARQPRSPPTLTSTALDPTLESVLNQFSSVTTPPFFSASADLIGDMEWPSPLAMSRISNSASDSSPPLSAASARRSSCASEDTPFLLNFSSMDSRTRSLPALFNTPDRASDSPGMYLKTFSEIPDDQSSTGSLSSFDGSSGKLQEDWADVLRLDGLGGIDLQSEIKLDENEDGKRHPLVQSAYFDTTRIMMADSEWINMLNVTDKEERAELMRLNQERDVNADRLRELVTELCSVAMSTPKHLMRIPYNVFKSSAQSLLTVENVDLFVKHFFQFWQPHVSILHPPSFDIKTTSLPLMLAVALVGSLYSVSEDHIAAARNLLDGAEEFVFTSIAFLELAGKYGQSETLVETRAHLEAIQAAYLICIVQSFNGTVEAQRHVRRQRFGEVVCALRTLSTPSVRNDYFKRPHPGMLDEFDWEAFIQSELKVRTLLHIYLLDCEHAIFHNAPGRFTITEMTGDLACWDESFYAPNAMYCHTHVFQEYLARPPSLSESIRLLLDASVPEEEVVKRLENASALNLFLFINTFNTMLFARRAMQPVSPPDNMHLALRRWRTLWENKMESLSEVQRRNMGFIKNAHEYSVLAERILNAMTHGQVMLVEVVTGKVDVDESSHVGEILTAMDSLSI